MNVTPAVGYAAGQIAVEEYGVANVLNLVDESSSQEVTLKANTNYRLFFRAVNNRNHAGPSDVSVTVLLEPQG